MKNIDKPTQKTYFIANTLDNYSWGIVDVDQVMTTPHNKLFTTTEELIWKAELAKINVKFGYQFATTEDVESALTLIFMKYGPVRVWESGNITPPFYYILGDYSDMLSEPYGFMVKK